MHCDLCTVHLGYFIGVITMRKRSYSSTDADFVVSGNSNSGSNSGSSSNSSSSRGGYRYKYNYKGNGDEKFVKDDYNCGNEGGCIYFGNNNGNNNGNNSSNDVMEHYLRRDEDDKALKDFNAMISLMLVSFSLGFRFLFMAMPFIFYSAGPIALVITATIMFCFLVCIDHPYSLLGCISVPTTTAVLPQHCI